MPKKKKMAAQAVTKPEERLSQSEIRQHLYLTGMQTDRFTVLLGPAQKSFRVPQGLLSQWSPVFEKMCRSPFKESIERVIRLPEDDVTTFKRFFIWIHALEPRLSIDSIDEIVDLAIFAEKYRVYHLKNQASDIIRAALVEDRWRITTATIAKVYSGVPAGTALRQLCFLGFLRICSVPTWYGLEDRYTKWETTFCNCPDLGWDYFKHIQTKGEDNTTVSSGGACCFHDHSDIHGWIRRNCTECPYPQGAPVDMPLVEEEKQAKGLREEDAALVDYAPPMEELVTEEAVEELAVNETMPVEEAVEEAVVGPC